MDVLFVHGYNVTSTKTYGALPQRLKAAGHRVRNVYLSKYVTLDNELTLDDVVRAFHAALEDLYGAALGKSKFACVTHSTGALVVRSWISAHFESHPGKNPISHLIMLAPPTFGSRLASLGKSRLSRLRDLAGVEPGLKILSALELGSHFQWDLNLRWLEKNTAGVSGFYPFVIAGQWIDKKMWDVIVPATYERGSDGVVRAASTNLNFRHVRVGSDGVEASAHEGFAFLLAPKASHSDERYGVMAGVPEKGDHPVLSALLSALAVSDGRTYRNLASDFQKKTWEVQTSEPYYDGTPLERYSQLIVRVRDQHGQGLSDYALELIDAAGRGDRFPTGFLAHSFQNSVTPDTFTYYLNYDRVTRTIGGQLGIRVHAVSGSPLVAYKEGAFTGSAFQIEQLLAPNQSTLVDLTVRRTLNKNVFRITKNLSYQKIERQAGSDWVE